MLWDIVEQVILGDERYWENRKADWIETYWKTITHPHRDTLLEVLNQVEFDSVLEIGCNCGPNLARIKEAFPGICGRNRR